ncbi:MAG TPA: hypothetical protein VE944_19855 [Nostoc sp.]|uniref:hypothetical protein n=1 Tax=Nostoc sp. TaxID=1180 RepID=UPI002D4CD6CB|nr:hypothetical protein [Nostoc sp.]HYX16576.1 hypothetical protein [Nostoc sp.]
MKRKIKIAITVIFELLLIISPDKRVFSQILPDDTFTIQNDGLKNTVTIYVGNGSNGLRSVNILSQKTVELSCTKESNVYIATRNSGSVNYKIDCAKGLRYSLAWNNKKNLWDIYKINRE